MPDREKRKVEMIESYWTGGEYGSNYQWNDNHGELVRCKDCRYGEPFKNRAGNDCIECNNDDLWLDGNVNLPDWFCADGKRKEGR